MKSLALLLGVVCVTRPVIAGEVPGPFSFDAQVLWAVEGGPLVVRSKLTYLGSTPILICWNNHFGQVGVDTEGILKKKPLISRLRLTNDGSAYGARLVQPGEALTDIQYLHHDHTPIPAGRLRLGVKWVVRRPGREGKNGGQLGEVLAAPSVTLPVTIPEATPAMLKATAQRLEREARASVHRTDQRNHLAACLLHTRHEAFVPVAVQLIKAGTDYCPSDYHYCGDDALLKFVYEAASSPQTAHAALVDYLRDPEPGESRRIFSFWESVRSKASPGYLRDAVWPARNCSEVLTLHLLVPTRLYRTSKAVLEHLQARKRLISHDQLKRLCEAPNVWVNVITVSMFGGQCDPRWVRQVQEKVRENTRPLTAGEFSPLLAQLDAERFSIREQATAALLRRGDVVVPVLRQALGQSLSVEARARVRRLLADLEEDPVAPLAGPALALLEASALEESPSRELLAVLAQGPPHAALTKQARAALTRVQGRIPPLSRKER